MPRPAILSFFLLIVAGIFFVVDAIIYSAVALAFDVVEPLLLILLGIVLGFFSASFIAATILGNYYHNAFTRVYYTVSAVWIGSSLYFFLVSILYGLAVLITGQPLHVVGIGLLCIALGMSVYGVLHAKRIAVMDIPVSLAHLPVSWQAKKAVWVSDLHLGQIHGPAFAEKITRKINSLSPAVVFIGGDLFDGTQAPDIKKLTAPLKSLAAPLGVYFVAGNHEEFAGNDAFIAAVKSMGIRVLSDEKVEIDGLQLIGVDYHNASDAGRFREILLGLNIDPHTASILLKHEPKDLAVAEAAGISLQISGHTHRAQLWPLEYIAELSYRGFVYGLHAYKQMQVYTSSGVGTWGPPMRLGTNSEIVVFSLSKKDL
jgi:uncharacterized protein